jgi:hypothetical protein
MGETGQQVPESPKPAPPCSRAARILEEKLGEFEKALKLYQKLATERGDAQARPPSSASPEIAGAFRRTRVPHQRKTRRAPQAPQHRTMRGAPLQNRPAGLLPQDARHHRRRGLDVSLIQPDKTWTLKPEATRNTNRSNRRSRSRSRQRGRRLRRHHRRRRLGIHRARAALGSRGGGQIQPPRGAGLRPGHAHRQPAEGVELLVSNGTAVAATGKTGGDGVFKTSLENSRISATCASSPCAPAMRPRSTCRWPASTLLRPDRQGLPLHRPPRLPARRNRLDARDPARCARTAPTRARERRIQDPLHRPAGPPAVRASGETQQVRHLRRHPRLPEGAAIGPTR